MSKKSGAEKWMSKRQIAALLYAARRSRWPNSYNCFLLMYLLGLRISEATMLEWSHLDSKLVDDRGLIRAIRVPTLKKRTWPPPLKTVPVLAHFKAVAAAFDPRRSKKIQSPYLFPSPVDHSRPVSRFRVDDAFRECRRKAGLPDFFTPHSLRHSAATLLRRTLKDELLVQRFLRHSDSTVYGEGHKRGKSTTGVYIHVDLSDYALAIRESALTLPKPQPLPAESGEREILTRMD